MAYSQKEVVENYLGEHYTESMTGADLSRILGIPDRSARRYLAEYKQCVSAPLEHVTIKPMNMEVVVFDIETTDFGSESYAGYLICCSFLNIQTGKIETLHIDFNEHGDDRRLLVEVTKKLAQYPFHIGHYIAGYDYNWLNSRLMYHGLRTLDTAVYFDTYYVARSMAITTRRGLGNLVDYFNLDGVKTTIFRSSWNKIRSPYREEFDLALDEITEHCILDVEANRRLFDVLYFHSLANTRTNPWKRSKMSGNYWGNNNV